MEFVKLKPLLAAKEGTDVGKTVAALKEFEVEIDIESLKKEWKPKKHAIHDLAKRPKRKVQIDYDDEVEGRLVKKSRTEIQEVTRIAIPMQKNIVQKAVTFLFGNPVTIKAETGGDLLQDRLLLAVKKVLEDNKVDSQNRAIAKALFKSTQVVEIWYGEQGETHTDYGFSTDVRLRMSVFSPWDGSQLFPYFGPNGDLIAFSRAYKMKDELGSSVDHFEVYTAEEFILWSMKTGTGWKEEKRTPCRIKKIPVVFASQEEAEWADVQAAIEQLETLISNHGDTNAYNGSPTIVVHGHIESFGKKGESGKVIEVEGAGKVEYLSWDSAPESIKMEIENLFKIILTYTQTPDISFESVKGLGAISGIALRFLFLDAHTKVMDKRETFDPYLKRRANIIKSYLAELDPTLAPVASKLKIDSEITPFTVRDLLEEVKVLTEANGGLAIMSHETSFILGAFTTDPMADFKKYLAEQKVRDASSVTESSF